MKSLKRLNLAGDTIVEVLIVLAVLGLAFSISSATASRSLTQSRNAEEHSQALGILNSQIELVRTAVTKQVDVFQNPGVPFCMTGSGTNPFKRFDQPGNLSSIHSNAANDTLTAGTAYPAECVRNGDRYFASVVYESGSFTIRVRWDGAGGLSRQQELMTYRTRALTPTDNSGYTLTAASTKVRITVQQIVPDLNNFSYDSPPCSLAATAGVNNVSTRLQSSPGYPAYDQSLTTNSSGIAVYDNLVEHNYFSASVTVPPNYTACGVTTSPVNDVTDTKDVTFTLTPTCQNKSKNRTKQTWIPPVEKKTYEIDTHDVFLDSQGKVFETWQPVSQWGEEHWYSNYGYDFHFHRWRGHPDDGRFGIVRYLAYIHGRVTIVDQDGVDGYWQDYQESYQVKEC
jgi:type II secretory pathway pseudopilin PulG